MCGNGVLLKAVRTVCTAAVAGALQRTSCKLEIGAAVARTMSTTIWASAPAGQPIEDRRNLLYASAKAIRLEVPETPESLARIMTDMVKQSQKARLLYPPGSDAR